MYNTYVFGMGEGVVEAVNIRPLTADSTDAANAFCKNLYNAHAIGEFEKNEVWVPLCQYKPEDWTISSIKAVCASHKMILALFVPPSFVVCREQSFEEEMEGKESV